MGGSGSRGEPPNVRASERPSLRTSQHLLHEDEFEPPIELAADLGHACRLDEAELAVQGERGFVAGLDAPEHDVLAKAPCLLDESGQQRRAEPFPPRPRRDVDRVLHGMEITLERPPVAEARIAEDAALLPLGDEDRVALVRPPLEPGAA